MILLIDNFDSYTYNLVDLLHRLDQEVIVVRNDQSIEQIKQLDFDRIVVSPGPGRPEDAGVTMAVFQKYYKMKPILGVCLGHQAIGEFFGAKLNRSICPKHGKIESIMTTEESRYLKNIPPFKAVRYNSLSLSSVPNQLSVEALSKDNEIMAIRHKEYPILGLQFHPESVLSQFGKKIVDQWISF